MISSFRILNIQICHPSHSYTLSLRSSPQYKKNIIRHMSEFHNMEQYQKYRCEDCDLDFGDQYHLNRHLNSKNCLKKSVEECKDCKKRFVSPDKLKVHQVKNCLKKYFCDVCLSFFKTKKIYLNHSHKSCSRWIMS